MIDHFEKVTDKESCQNKNTKYIDDFIRKNPKISPNKKIEIPLTENQFNKAPEELMTETLAKMYFKQNKFEQAISAYEILSLKNPKKSIYFEEQISSIKHLQDKHNS